MIYPGAMKLLLHPGGALFTMAGLAFFVRMTARWIPFLGGFISTVALFAIIFGVLGGIFLTFVVRKSESPA